MYGGLTLIRSEKEFRCSLFDSFQSKPLEFPCFVEIRMLPDRSYDIFCIYRSEIIAFMENGGRI